MKSLAYATLSSHDRNGSPYYRIRFNQVASRAFNGFTHCDLLKADGYIVISPSTEWEKNKQRYKLCLDSFGGVVISCKRLVEVGFFKAEWFNKSYKVKKTKDGRIVICLREEVS